MTLHVNEFRVIIAGSREFSDYELLKRPVIITYLINLRIQVVKL